MIRETLDRWCERGILVLVLAILIFAPLATGAVRAQDFLVVQGLTLGVMVLWGIRIWLSEKAKFLWPPICWVVLAFMAYAVYRYWTCDIEYVGRREFIQVLVYGFLFFAILNNLHRQEFTQVISFTLIFLAMAIASYAIYQFMTHSKHIWHFPAVYVGRGSGTYINPNHLAGFLEMLLPLALAYPIAGRIRPVTRILIGYAAAVMMIGIGVTLSRGGWAACGLSLIGLFTVLTFYRSFRLPAVLVLVVLLGGGSFLASKSFQLQHRLSKSQGTKEEVLDVRFHLWQAAARMWREHVWFGVGPGHYDYRFAQYRSEIAQMRPDLAHNDYMNTLADWGAVGAGLVVLWLGALGVGVVKCWRYVRRSEVEFKSNMSNKFAFVLGASIGLLALLAHSVVDFNMHIPANALLAVSLAALLSGHVRFATERFWVRARWWSKLPASILLLAGLGYLGNQEVRLGREWLALDQATKSTEFATARFTALKSAAALEPNNFETSYLLGELYRTKSFDGVENFEELAKEAMSWFGRGTNSNPHDPLNYIGYGMCLDWLGQHAEAEPYFKHADELDPNGFLASAQMGWHYVQMDNYIAAKAWFERSIRLSWTDNKIAATYLPIVSDRLSSVLTDKVTRPALPAQ